jgi:hypothetical protein
VSILPEVILQQVLVRGFRAFRENEDLFRMLFRNLTTREQEDIVAYFRKTPIDICLNYPNTDVKIAFIAIMMGGDAETNPILGDLQQSSEDFQTFGRQPFPKEELLGDQTVLGAGTVGRVDGPAGSGKLLLPPTTAESGSVNTIVAPRGTTNLIDPFEENQVYAVILEGTGAGQTRSVSEILPSLSGGPVVITVATNWDTNPDNTSVFKLVSGADPVQMSGEPAQLFTSSQHVERLGQLYESTYRLDIGAAPQEGVTYLYAVVKAIMFIARGDLEKQGILQMRMSGADLSPLGDAQPDIVFRRSLTLTFKHSFDVIRELSQEVATQIRLALSVYDPDILDSTDIERVVSTTTVTT